MVVLARRLKRSANCAAVKSGSNGSGPTRRIKSILGTSTVGIKRTQPNLRWSLKYKCDPSVNSIMTRVDLSGSEFTKLSFGWPPAKRFSLSLAIGIWLLEFGISPPSIFHLPYSMFLLTKTSCPVILR